MKRLLRLIPLLLCLLLGVLSPALFCASALKKSEPSAVSTAAKPMQSTEKSEQTEKPLRFASSSLLDSAAAEENAASEQFLWPVPYTKTVTQGFSFGKHYGIDISDRGILWQPVFAAKSGTVVRLWDGCQNSDGMKAQGQGCSERTGCALHELSRAYQVGGSVRRFCNNTQGNALCIRHGAFSYTSYYHLVKLTVKQGEVVRQGQLIGYVGSSGISSGPHLHFAVHQSYYTSLGSFSDPQRYSYLDTLPQSEEPMVQFCAGQGECTSEPLRFYTAGESLGPLPAAERDGYVFLGWQYADGSFAAATDTVPGTGLFLCAAYEKAAPSERGESRS